MRRCGRARRLAALAVGVVVGAVSAACAPARSDHGDPDPGGRILVALKTVERAVPADARQVLRQANEPRWDSCDGRAGTFGWDDVTVYTQFRTGQRPRRLIATVGEAMRAAGWTRVTRLTTPLGPGLRWSRPTRGSTVATAMLAPETRGDGTGISWDLDAVAPPQGPRVSGC